MTWLLSLPLCNVLVLFLSYLLYEIAGFIMNTCVVCALCVSTPTYPSVTLYLMRHRAGFVPSALKQCGTVATFAV